MALRPYVCASLLFFTCSPAPADGPPATPSELAVSELGGGAHVTWKDNATNEDEFQLQRKEGAGDFSTLVTVLFDATQYHDASPMRGVDQQPRRDDRHRARCRPARTS